MMSSSPSVNLACWGSVSSILLNLTIPFDGSVAGPAVESRLHPNGLVARHDAKKANGWIG